MIRTLIHLSFAVLLTGAVLAQDVAIRADHPDEYVVVKGDTLWDISGRFLEKPWQWPAIWQANPQIENPHLIYPGDVISLVYIDGVPQLQINRAAAAAPPPPKAPAPAPAPRVSGNKPVVKLSPQVHVLENSDPINTIPLDQIEPFLRDVRMVSEAEYEGLPYIVSNGEDRLNASHGDKAYARGLNAEVGEELVVARLNNIYDRVKKDGEIRRVLPKEHWKQVPNVHNRNETLWNDTLPWKRRPKNPIGYELIVVSQVRVAQAGEISVLEILHDRTEIQPGDRIMKLDDRGFRATFFPSAIDRVPEGARILATRETKYGVSHYQIVSMNLGSSQGVEPGNVFSVFRPGQKAKDRVGYRWGSFSSDADLRLPAEYNGLVMVFRTFDTISYALVMAGDRSIREFDEVRHPSERL